MIGQIIGASNYDIGHLALGQPGGGVANLGVVGRSNKAGGCTGIPTPTGDFYAIDYVAHEMGHQFSGNHPFNGNQLNCSGGNRNAATSVEPGSGSSIMAYAGICLTDDLQPHSDPYFSQRSLQEISTYTSSNQAAINEVQTASLRHFGGGNEVQVVTFGPGYAAGGDDPAAVASRSTRRRARRSRGGAAGERQHGHDRDRAAAHTLQVGDSVTIAGVAAAGYNGTFTVTAVPTRARSSTRTRRPASPTSGGGTVTLAAPGATESGTTVTIRTAAAHNRSVGDVVTISGVGVAGYNGTFTITAVPTPRTFQYTNATAGLANSGGGTATYFSPFQVRIGGNDSAVIGGSGLPYTQREHPDRDQRDRRASPARRPSPARPRPASRSPTAAPRPASTSRASQLVNLELRRLLRLGRGDEPRRRERLVHASTTTATSRRRSRTASTTRPPGSWRR